MYKTEYNGDWVLFHLLLQIQMGFYNFITFLDIKICHYTWTVLAITNIAEVHSINYLELCIWQFSYINYIGYILWFISDSGSNYKLIKKLQTEIEQEIKLHN